jgi:hypothetical protein
MVEKRIAEKSNSSEQRKTSPIPLCSLLIAHFSLFTLP